MGSAKRALAACFFVWLATCGIANGQRTVVVERSSTLEGDILRGQGAFLRGAGWYNLNTARAVSTNTDAAIRWKADLRKIQRERDLAEAQKKYEKNKNVEQLRQQIAQREQELRTNPSPDDVQSGAALNALIYDLMDPQIESAAWNFNPVPLPPDTSVKELIFSFTPHRVSTQASSALSRGVIALSRLDIKDRWPVILKKDELAGERKAYEDAYQKVKERVLSGQYSVKEILALDTALDALKRKVQTEIPSERGYRAEAMKFVEDLREATRMFDANSVDYAKEILIDTQDHDATTVQELVEFMSKYRLQFSSADRSPPARVLYGQIYEKLNQQADKLNIKVDLAGLTSIPAVPTPPAEEKRVPAKAPADQDGWVSLFNGKDLQGWKSIPLQKAKYPPGTWKVVNGILTLSGGPARVAWEESLTGNFQFRAEVMRPTTTDLCYLLVGIKPDGTAVKGEPNRPSDLRLLLSSTQNNKKQTGGDLLSSHDGFATKALQNATRPVALDPGKWATVQVNVTGRTIEARIDGSTVLTHEATRPPILRGAVGFFVPGGVSGSTMYVRKAELRRLP